MGFSVIDIGLCGANFGGQEMRGEEERGCEGVVPCLVGEIGCEGERVIQGKEGNSCTRAFCDRAVAAIRCKDGACLVSSVDCFWVEGIVSVC